MLNLLNLEGTLIICLALFFYQAILKTFNSINGPTLQYSSFNSSFRDGSGHRNLQLLILLGWSLGILIVGPTWWPIHPFLCLALIFSLGTYFIHYSFTLTFFILLLFLRPWELVPLGFNTMDSVGFLKQQFPFSQGISIPQLWVFLIFCTFLFQSRQILKIRWSRTDLSIFLFAGSFLPLLILRGSPQQMDSYLSTLVRSVLIYFIFRLFTRTRQDLEIQEITLGFIGIFLIFSSLFIWSAPSELSTLQQSQSARLEAFGLFQNSNDLGSLIVFSFPFLLGIVDRRSRSTLSKEVKPFFQGRWALKLIFIALAFYSVWLTESRGTLLGFLLSLAAYFNSRGSFRIFHKKGWIGFGVLIFLLLQLFTSISHRSPSDIHVSTVGRLNYWLTALRMFVHHPFLGVGFDNYSRLFESYTLHFYETGERTAHSLLFLVLAEGGIFSSLFYFYILIRSAQLTFNNRKQNPEIFASTLGYLVTALFLSHSYLFFIFILFAMIETSDELSRIS